jgi:hypothetical protein
MYVLKFVIIKLGQNPMESAGCFSIVKILQKNPTTKLELIDFTDIIVDKFFKEEYEKFRVAFPSIQVKTGCDGLKLKPKAKVHPIVKIKNYVDKKNLKILDFFLEYDKDSLMTVSKSDFVAGIRNIGLATLRDEELNQLVEEVDLDESGNVNYR